MATHVKVLAVLFIVWGALLYAFLPITVATSIPSLICGVGLLKFKRWARILGIVLAALTLIHFPFGTAFGVYALYVLFQKGTEALLST